VCEGQPHNLPFPSDWRQVLMSCYSWTLRTHSYNTIFFVKVTGNIELKHVVQVVLEWYRDKISQFFFLLVAPTLGSLLPLLEHRAEINQNQWYRSHFNIILCMRLKYTVPRTSENASSVSDVEQLRLHEKLYYTVTHMPFARQRLGKHIPATTNTETTLE
jgi:hypothetical protein